MGGFACLCKGLKANSKPGKARDKEAKNHKIVERSLLVEPAVTNSRDEPYAKHDNCNCGWEVETGCAVASGLSILEAKRLFIITVGVFAEWSVINFSGGFIPLVITIVSASIGTPASLLTLFALHKRRKRPCFPLLRNLMKCMTALIFVCGILNIAIMASTFVYTSTSPTSIAQLFNTSMSLYSRQTWHKVIIDEFQFTFQCCGHTKYDDWIAFDWQQVDYAFRDEMSSHRRISDERYRPMAVPYSCCNKRVITPCFHADISMENVEHPTSSSINAYGCADDISHIVLRSAAISYCVSTFLVLTQILLTFITIKIVKGPFPSTCPSICDCINEKCSSLHPLLESTSTSCMSSSTGVRTSSGDRRKNMQNMQNVKDSCSSRCSVGKRKRRSRLSTISSGSTECCERSRSSSRSPSPPLSSVDSNNSKSEKPCGAEAISPISQSQANHNLKNHCSNNCAVCAGAARIRPSLHTEHRLPNKRSLQKRK